MDPSQQFLSSQDVYFPGILHDIKKSTNHLQPVFEALTNSLESLRLAQRDPLLAEVKIVLHFTRQLDLQEVFERISVVDNGIGFNEDEFRRFNRFRDTTKGFSNFGSGRIQYVHFFDETNVTSNYLDIDGAIRQRQFVISKKQTYIQHGAIVLQIHDKPCQGEVATQVDFLRPLDKRDKEFYTALTPDELKKIVMKRYFALFCHYKEAGVLPTIIFRRMVEESVTSETRINIEDIPEVTEKGPFELRYQKIGQTGEIEAAEDKEEFVLNCFKQESSKLDANEIKVVSKGELVEKTGITLENIKRNDSVGSMRYVVFISSKYFDQIDGHVRGQLRIASRKNASDDIDLIDKQVIFLEDIQREVTSEIDDIFPELLTERSKQESEIEELKKMFNIVGGSDVNISINDSEQRILEKFYESEARKAAELDANIKKDFERVESLDPRSSGYKSELLTMVESITAKVPIQNKNALSHYIARRRIILDLFKKCLDDGATDESFIHNLFFAKKALDPIESDLWMLNEEFVYYEGSSEKTLSQVKYRGKKVLKETFISEELIYLNSLGERRRSKRPDILLFPSESRCIIVEFKDKSVNVSDHLSQVEKYASLILNNCHDDTPITTFYAYIIGEAIVWKDVLAANSRYEESIQFDYLYKPSERVRGFDGKKDGSIYCEVHRYRTVLDRSFARNRIFFDKLGTL